MHGSALTLDVAVSRFPSATTFVITDISRDGMLSGPDVAGLVDIAARTTTPIIASGGVAGLDDLRALRDARVLAGAIVGKAIYEGRFTVGDAIGVLRA